jgi:hypothetical protein
MLRKKEMLQLSSRKSGLVFQQAVVEWRVIRVG